MHKPFSAMDIREGLDGNITAHPFLNAVTIPKGVCASPQGSLSNLAWLLRDAM